MDVRGALGRIVFRSKPSDESLGYYHLSLPGQ
jgi:hypothetical protein